MPLGAKMVQITFKLPRIDYKVWFLSKFALAERAKNTRRHDEHIFFFTSAVAMKPANIETSSLKIISGTRQQQRVFRR